MINNALIKKFIYFSKEIFGNADYFSCIYGSQIHGKSSKKSDIDVLFVVNDYVNYDIKKIRKDIVDFHLKNGLFLDNEVPFENKLLTTYEDLSKAVYLGGFELVNDKFSIPKVVKTDSFLNSTAIIQRLALYALTAPHRVFGNSIEKYSAYKKIAETNIVLLAIDLIDKDFFDSSLILESLLVGKNNENGELYLGYKKYPVVLEYLQKLIERQLKVLSKKGSIIVRDGKVKIASNESLIYLKMKAAYKTAP